VYLTAGLYHRSASNPPTRSPVTLERSVAQTGVADDPESFADLDGHSYIGPGSASRSGDCFNNEVLCTMQFYPSVGNSRSQKAAEDQQHGDDLRPSDSHPKPSEEACGHFGTGCYLSDDYKVDTRSHGSPHIDREDSNGRLVGRYNEDGKPIKFKGKTPPDIPNSDKGKFESAAQKLRDYKKRKAESDRGQKSESPNRDRQPEKTPNKFMQFDFCAGGPCDGTPYFFFPYAPNPWLFPAPEFEFVPLFRFPIFA
jgi:hypothetical protein